MSSNFIKFFFVTTLFSSFFISAQQKVDVDQMLKNAIEAKSKGQNEEALKISEAALKYSPDYTDFNILLGTIYNQQMEPDKAIAHFEKAAAVASYKKEAEMGLGTAYELKKDLRTALKIYNTLLENYPHEAFFYKKAIGLSDEMKDYENAVKYAELWTKNIPQDLQAQKTLLYYQEMLVNSKKTVLPENILTSSNFQNRIGLAYMPSLMENSRFHIVSLEYLRRAANKKNTLITKINYGNRNSNTGFQFDAEDYWVHSKKNYSFFNAAFSADDIFPDFRAGYSLFTGLNKGWELETGARYIRVAEQNTYTLVLGGSKEFENNWLNLKNYVTLNNQQYYPSHVLTWRHFLNEERDYFSIILGLGISPEVQNNQYSFNGYKDKSVGAGYQKKLGNHYMFAITSVYNRLFFGNGIYKDRVDIYANLYYQF